MMYLESELNAECVLAGQRVGIAETFGVSAAVAGESQQVLSLEINAGILHFKFVLNVFGQGVAEREGLQAQERAVFDVVVRTFVLLVVVVDRGSRDA